MSLSVIIWPQIRFAHKSVIFSRKALFSKKNWYFYPPKCFEYALFLLICMLMGFRNIYQCYKCGTVNKNRKLDKNTFFHGFSLIAKTRLFVVRMTANIYQNNGNRSSYRYLELTSPGFLLCQMIFFSKVEKC